MFFKEHRCVPSFARVPIYKKGAYLCACSVTDLYFKVSIKNIVKLKLPFHPDLIAIERYFLIR
jgi:hypothetical protein